MDDKDTLQTNQCTLLNQEKEILSPVMQNDSLALLPPEHPLLKKFQQSLKEHLLRTRQKLQNEISDIQNEVKVKEQRREEQGLSLYEMQQRIVFQGEQIKEITAQIEEYIYNRTEEEKAVAHLKSEYEKKIKLTKEEKALYNKRMVELEHLQTLASNIKKWAFDVEDEVKNAKRIVSKNSQMQKQLSEEKRKSDILFYRLGMEVKKKETELQTICEEEIGMIEVINILNMSIADANTDLETLQNEHKRLTQSWNEVIIAIQLRDKILFQVTENLRKEKESIKLNTTGIGAIKKQISKEMELNRKLEAFKLRLDEDLNNLKRECKKEAEVLGAVQTKLEELPDLLACTENDLHEATKEGHKVESDLRRLNFKLDKLYQKKFRIEETILKLAQEQLITHKASAYRLKLLNKSQEQRRKMDIALAKTQHQLASAIVDLERIRGQLFLLQQENEQLQSNMDAAEYKFDAQETELRVMQTQIETKMNRFDKINTQIEQAVKSIGDVAESPTELLIKQTEKSIQGAEQQIREHQQFWIMLQNHFVNLSQKRNFQLNEIQVTRKQLSIIKQKSLKIDNDLEISETKTKELKLDIQKFTSQLELLNDKMFKKRKHHENEESDCEMEHMELTQKLKDNEMEILKIEEEIDELQTEIDLHKDLVLDKHREALSWETKYKLNEETINWSKAERSVDGDIGAMKTEIHRMNIRYDQLKRAQEKLVQDLEHCVMHREQIFVAATVKEHVEAKMMRGKIMNPIQAKLTDLRNKIKLVQHEIDLLTEGRLGEITHEIERIEHILMKAQEDISQILSEDYNLCTRIEECILHKHVNLEQIVRKQNRAKAYRKLQDSKLSPKTPRPEITIQAHIQRQNEINDNLMEIIQICINDFPVNKPFFTKLLHVLKE